jgi:hypothetical protein
MKVLESGDYAQYETIAVVEIKNILLSSNGTCTIYVELQSARIKAFDRRKISEKDDYGSSHQVNGALIYTGEDITLKRDQELNIDERRLHTFNEILVSSSMHHQMQQGYRLYLPTTTSGFLEFWKLKVGWTNPNSSNSISIVTVNDGIHDHIVPRNLVAR